MPCETEEVYIALLPPGCCFELSLCSTAVRGVVVEQCSGSTSVNIGNYRVEHWCKETPVISRPEAKEEDWLQFKSKSEKTEKGETEMTKTEKKAKVAKVPEVEKFEISAKESKTMLDMENMSRAAIVYRAIVKHGPLDLDALFSIVKKDFMPFRGNPENIRGNVRTFVREFFAKELLRRA